MRIVIVGFNQHEKKAVLYRQVSDDEEDIAFAKAAVQFVNALEEGATIISTRVLEEEEEEK